MEKEYLLKKWLNNDLSESEAMAFQAMEGSELYKEIIEEAQRFNGTTQEKVDDFELLKSKLKDKEKKPVRWMNVAARIAAVFILGIGIFTYLDRDQINNFATISGQKQSITLPDNSIVTLNESSELLYKASQWEDKRILNLKGEAYFDVEKGKRFDVITDEGTVSVLGTEFNVLSREGVFKVSCYEGLVQVAYNSSLVQVPAGTEFTLGSGNLLKSDVLLSQPTWLNNMSVFENAAFKNVILELENQYQVKIQFPKDTNRIFTGAFEHDDLENALRSITQPLDMTYIILNDKEIMISNGQN
ncbi:FecR family protein [uncultured Nonlabens sp.]|jgi:transmembrane sensor|uniref:FecR family protein n=1 Tax=uncultured Nonlabens sp. TaxID=859306 RepID=UPI0030DA8AF6|tara:strand:- start:152 stop:1054 length:903 start_codon:yes stop_codon:yes gene_type:complete